MIRSTNRRLAAALTASLLVLAACGDGTGTPAAADLAPTTSATNGDGTASAADDPAPSSVAQTSDDGSNEYSDGEATGDETLSRSKPVVEPLTPSPSELVVTELIAGSGDPAEAGDSVALNAVGVLSDDGTEVISTYEQSPVRLTAGSGTGITGLDQALIGLTKDSRVQVDIPADLAFGDTGDGGQIPPGAALTFVIDVIDIEKPPPPPSLAPQADPADCPAVDGSSPKQQEFSEYPPTCIDVTKTYTAQVVTNFGELTIELDPAKAPVTVNSFVTLARYHYFDDTECHRAMPSFVVQCGDPTATGSGGPGYRFADELPLAGEYVLGSLAMANSGPDTNGSQFFIITGPNGIALDPNYSLFGQVTDGLDTTVAAMDAVANPGSNGVPPLEQILIESVTITES